MPIIESIELFIDYLKMSQETPEAKSGFIQTYSHSIVEGGLDDMS